MTEDGSSDRYEIDDAALSAGDAESGATTLGDPGNDPPRPRKKVAREFVIQVLLLNLGFLAVALGLMMLYFRWWLDMGSGLIVVGLVALLAAYRRYKLKPPNTG